MLEEMFDVRLWSHIVCICHVIFVSKSYKKYQSSLILFSVETSQPQNVLNLLLFTVFIATFQPRYS